MNKFPLSQPPLPLVFYKWQGKGRAPALTGGGGEVWAGQIWKGRSPASENSNPGAAQAAQLSLPWKSNLWNLGVLPGAIQMGLCRSTIQEEISLAAELPPQPLAEHATKPATRCQFLWRFCCCEVPLSPPWVTHTFPSFLTPNHMWPEEMSNREPFSWYPGATSLITTGTQQKKKCVALPHHPHGAGDPCVVHVCKCSPASGSKSHTVSMLRYS